MNRSRRVSSDLLPQASALQHKRSPRPLPLFLELVRQGSEHEPDLARDALAGLRIYAAAPRPQRPPAKPEAARVEGACLREYGGAGPPAVLIPSLINPPHILDLDEDVSLAAAVARMGRRALLLDWGKAGSRSALSVAGHVEELLVPLLRNIGQDAALVGYCLGGTMAIAAANLVPCDRVATLACPWRFGRYPPEARSSLASVWQHSQAAAGSLGALPMEVLQAAFWSLDPERTVAKFAEFGRLPPDSDQARRFVTLEDWANEGEPLPCRAAQELLEDLFGRDLPGQGEWRVGGRPISERLTQPVLHLTAQHDRIVPPETAPEGRTLAVPSGHVGMVVGRARGKLHEALKQFLDPACR